MREYRVEVGVLGGLIWPKFQVEMGRLPPSIRRVAKLDASTFYAV